MQRPRGLAIGAVEVRLRCGHAREQEWEREVAWRELGRGDALARSVRARAVLDGAGTGVWCRG